MLMKKERLRLCEICVLFSLYERFIKRRFYKLLGGSITVEDRQRNGEINEELGIRNEEWGGE